MSTPPPPTTEGASGAPPAGGHLFSAAQRDQIEHVLREVRGNKTAAAQLLGMSRRSLYRWLDRLSIEK
jgi:transcriptional regulator with PAS, ATPase and Fis domain